MGAISGAGSAYPSGAPEFIPVFSGVRVTRSLVLYECFVDRYLSFSTFSFGHCVVCSSSIYGFWLPLWYLQTHLRVMMFVATFNNISAISWRSVVLVEKTTYLPQVTDTHNVARIHLAMNGIRTHNLCGDILRSHKSNYHTITTTTANNYMTRREQQLFCTYTLVYTKWCDNKKLSLQIMYCVGWVLTYVRICIEHLKGHTSNIVLIFW